MQSRLVQLYRVAPEQVVQFDIAQLRDADFARDKIGIRGHGHHAQAIGGTQIDGACARGVRFTRQRDNGLCDAETLGDLANLVLRTEHLDPHDLAAAVVRVVVQQRDDAPLPAVGQFLEEGRCHAARAQHDDRHRLGRAN